MMRHEDLRLYKNKCRTATTLSFRRSENGVEEGGVNGLRLRIEAVGILDRIEVTIFFYPSSHSN